MVEDQRLFRHETVPAFTSLNSLLGVGGGCDFKSLCLMDFSDMIGIRYYSKAIQQQVYIR